jgi:Fic family protein
LIASAPRYKAAIPNFISSYDIDLPNDIHNMLDDALMIMTRFDTFIAQKNYSLPSILLRSESASSSQIENLTASSKNIAMAELSNNAPGNSKTIAKNISAMKKAIESADELSVHTILEVHKTLLDGLDFAGRIRDEQVWVGGSAYGPGGAHFVPPQHMRVPELLDDLVLFAKRSNLNFIAKAALMHAQFETIHPFVDGNGRTGRALTQITLRQDNVLLNSALPISAGLLHDVKRYFDALDAYHNGEIVPIVSAFCEAITLACQIGKLMSERLDVLLDRWHSAIDARENNNIWKLLNILIEQPVLNPEYLQNALGISLKTAYNVIEQAEKFKIIKHIGNAHKGAFYEAKDITSLLDDVCKTDSLRRLIRKS